MDIGSLFGSSFSSYSSTYSSSQSSNTQQSDNSMFGSGDSQGNQGGASGIYDQKTFGAAVVSATMDNLNNNNGGGGSNSLFDINKKVLGAFYGTGSIFSSQG